MSNGCRSLVRQWKALRTMRTYSSQTSSVFNVERLKNEDSGIVLFEMNRPETKNAISKEMLSRFRESVDIVRFDRTVRVVIVCSRISGAFCTGADLKERATMKPEEVPAFVDSARALMMSLEQLPQPVIAAIDGFALGGGLEMALACDLRFASNTAKMGLTETRLAIIPGAGGTQRLPRIVGLAKAKELIYTARVIDGKEAARIGLVNEAVEQTSDGMAAKNKALEVAKEILKNGPIGVRMAKLATNHGSQCDLTTALAIEQQCYAQVIPTKDRIEALMAFKEKRPPVFKGE